MTLDGYFEGEKPWDLAFHQSMWGPDLEKFIIEQLKTAEMLVFGENTYKGMAEYWSQPKEQEEGQDEVAELMNSLPKIVCSTSPTSAEWQNSTVIKDAVAEIQKLKQEGEGNMFVFGSAILSESLMKAGLFDEYRLGVAPIFLGKGRHLFAEGIPHQKLALLEDQQLESGGVILRYAPANN